MRPVVRPQFQKIPPWLALVLSLGACAGNVGGNSNPTGTGTAGTGTTVGSAGAGASGVGGVSGGSTGTTGIGGDGALAACPTTAITPTPLRRLTKFEYTNSVRNLLNVDTTPVNDLPADEVTDGFNNNAGILTVSPLHAEKYVPVVVGAGVGSDSERDHSVAYFGYVNGWEWLGNDFRIAL